MSTEGFNQLFAGYPACPETDRLRQRVQVSVANSISEMQACQQQLGGATFADYKPMYDVISAIDTLELRILPGAPRSIDLAYSRVTQTYTDTLHTYTKSVDGRTRRGALGLLFPKDGRPTRSEFNEMKAATALVLVDILVWLRGITPSS